MINKLSKLVLPLRAVKKIFVIVQLIIKKKMIKSCFELF